MEDKAKKLYEKKLAFAKKIFVEHIDVVQDWCGWWVVCYDLDTYIPCEHPDEVLTLPIIETMWKYPEWNGWRWIIPNSLDHPGNIENTGKDNG